MGEAGRDLLNLSTLQSFLSDIQLRWAEKGLFGIAITVILGLVLPVLLFSLFSWGRKRYKRRAVHVDVSGEAGYTMRNKKFTSLVRVPWEGATTMASLFEDSCKKYEKERFLGTRKVIHREVTLASEGKKLEKLHLGEYEWLSYGSAFDRSCNFASGLANLGHDLNSPAAIFSETRAEWLIAFQGCFRQNITVVTIYSSLGDEALVHSLNETEACTIICDSKQLKKLAAIGLSLKSIKHIVYFEDGDTPFESAMFKDMSHWKVLSFNDVERAGKEIPYLPRLPLSDDVAVIMYTSGSTGLPKGVLMSHGNLVATAAAVMTIIPKIGDNDIFLAYLPLAHVFELEAETVMLSSGCAIGYGSPLTMIDTSNKIKKGTKGDASVLHPTLMTVVPAILDRVRDGVLKKINEKGGLSKKLFNFAYKRRLATLEGSWFGAWALEKLIWDAIIFNKVRAVLGGGMRFMLCGGAPLSSDTQRFINICFGITIGQGYGLTETCAGAAFSEYDDSSVGRVGPPLPCCYIKLISWEEGGYMISDTPMPRGEIVIGGYSITKGYFKNQAKTDEVYKVDERGIRWFYSGDIGQIHPDGCLEIIDRKKDIVKLQHGEYISLGKIEAALVTGSYVDNIMVNADPFHNFCVALVVPSQLAVEKWAKNRGINFNDFPDLCQKEETVHEVQQSLSKVAELAKLNKFETPAKIVLLPDPWTPESGLVTAALKLKREQLKAKFKDELQNLYK